MLFQFSSTKGSCRCALFGKYLFVAMGIGTVVLCLVVCFYSAQGGELEVTDQVYFDISIDDEPAGRVVIGLFGEELPKTVKNFVTLASTGMEGKTYTGTHFHRVIKGFMVQGGDVINGDGTGTTSIYGQLFADEGFNVKHAEAGIISMANSGPDTNGCQFFITSSPAPWLDGKHVAFGKVLSGLDVINKIEEIPVDEESRPEKTVIIAESGVLKSDPIKIPVDTFNIWTSLLQGSVPVSFSVCILTFFYWSYRQLSWAERTMYKNE